VFLVGSARFGLMIAGNIDFEVYCDKPDAVSGNAVMREIAATPGVTGLQAHDFMDTADPGLYWRLDYQGEDGGRWDFDIWLVPNSHPHAGMADALARAMSTALTPRLRADILMLKAGLAARAKAQCASPPRGIDIYRAALAGNVRDLPGFDAWQARNPPPDMETWRPGP